MWWDLVLYPTQETCRYPDGERKILVVYWWSNKPRGIYNLEECVKVFGGCLRTEVRDEYYVLAQHFHVPVLEVEAFMPSYSRGV